MTLLAVSGLTKSFGAVRAVNGVDFTLKSGEMTALIGPNGAGKSSCFNLIGGQLAPDSGSIRLDGHELVGTPPHRLFRMGLGRTFQIAATFGSMTVRENVQMSILSAAYRLFAPFPSAKREHVLDAMVILEELGIATLADRVCGELAYGDVKRVELAVALADRPRLLLMDEPTAGMTPEDRESLMALVHQLARSQGMGVLFTEHDMDVVFAHADHVMAMNGGQIIAQGSPLSVRQDPAVIACYLGGKKAVPPAARPL
ncbi:MAG TPA: ABC transporter ATP-binding protein [Patescibacteria group bacterium]|jgi:branched-chain amino acid transport system ATP-binding protein|nr:ABC transporter ATP-binding protein [Patescibacteria group bacterium]